MTSCWTIGSDGVLSAQSADVYLGIDPRMPKWVDAGCLLTLYVNGWRNALAKSVQLF